jgi:transcriptional regulator GlxA family with amidase domain
MADDTAHSFGHKEPFTNWPNSPVVQTTDRLAAERAGTARDPQRQLRLAETFIRNNIYNPVSIADIATATGVNIRSLQRLFRKHRGITPVQALLDFRIAAAHKTIRTGKASSVRELAATFHFSNPGRFSKLYRKTYSCTPSEEIRSQQGRAPTRAK